MQDPKDREIEDLKAKCRQYRLVCDMLILQLPGLGCPESAKGLANLVRLIEGENDEQNPVSDAG